MYLGMLKGSKQLSDSGLPFNFVEKNGGSKAERVLLRGKKGLTFLFLITLA